MTYKNLISEVKDRAAFVTINRPKVLNALNSDTVLELEDLFKELKDAEEVGVIIITGAGERAFVSGADINELALLSPIEAKRYINRGQAVFSMIENLGKPTIAAINGYALGGGLELAMSCTIRIASENARLGQPEIILGLLPGYGGTQRLPRLVGKGKAMEMILTGDMIDAAEAYRIGLVNKVVPLSKLMEEAEKMARAVLSRGPLAVTVGLEAVNKGMEMPLNEAIAFEGGLMATLFATEDRVEGCKAFLEKRKPEFKGR